MSAVEDPHVAKALNFICNHAGESTSVTDVLKQVPLCRRYLEFRFRKATRRSPYEEIRRAYVERAKKLLAETNLPLDRIAEASGFSEMKHLLGRLPCLPIRREKMTSKLPPPS